MNTPRSNLGDTWRTRYGSRVGVQQRTIHGVPEPVRTRTAVWSSDGSPVLGELGESEWTLRNGKISTAEPVDSPDWAILVAKTAFQKAAKEAVSQRPYFENRVKKAKDFYAAMYSQSKSIPEILAHAKGQIGHSAPNASKWLTERAKRYAIKFEGYDEPTKTKSQRRESSYEPAEEVVVATPPQTFFEKAGAALGVGGETVKNVAVAAGVVAIAYPLFRLIGGSRAQA